MRAADGLASFFVASPERVAERVAEPKSQEQKQQHATVWAAYDAYFFLLIQAGRREVPLVYRQYQRHALSHT